MKSGWIGVIKSTHLPDEPENSTEPRNFVSDGEWRIQFPPVIQGGQGDRITMGQAIRAHDAADSGLGGHAVFEIPPPDFHILRFTLLIT